MKVAVTLVAFSGVLAGPTQGAGQGSASPAAQEPPPVVPDSAPVAPDPAPVAPDPAPAQPNSASPPAPDSASPAAPRQSSPAQPAPTQVPATGAADAVPRDLVGNAKRTRLRKARTRTAARAAAKDPRSKRGHERPPTGSRLNAPVLIQGGLDSDSGSGRLTAAGFGLLLLALLSGAFLRYISPLVRGRELQRR